MRNLLIFCVTSLFFSTSRATAIIKGHVIDASHSKITILDPINGFCNRLITLPTSATAVGPDGYFQKLIDVDFPVMITITIGRRPIWVFVEPGDVITVGIDADRLGTSSPGDGIRIKGTNGAGNTFYNRFNYNPGAKFDDFQRLLDSAGFKSTLSLGAVDHALSAIIRPFDSLLNKGQITKTFYDVVTSDTRNVLLSHLVRFAFTDKRLTIAQALAFFDGVYARYPLTEAAIKGGLYGTSPCHDYYYIKARRMYPNDQVPDSMVVAGGKTVFVNKNLVPYLYAPTAMGESLWAFDLIRLNRTFAGAFGARDADAFLAIFPHSKMRAYLQPPYYRSNAGPVSFGDSSGYVFVASEKVNSFDSLLIQFRGRRLLVDLWATWCVPCKLEFGYNAPTDSFCHKHDIGRVYIAFERGPTRNNVKRDVYAYNLKGFHIIANDSLINDMTHRIFPPSGGYVIPHYLLIDEKGGIVDKDAPRPSEGNALLSRMRAIFNFDN